MKDILDIAGEYEYTHHKGGKRHIIVSVEDDYITGLEVILDIYITKKKIKTVTINLDKDTTEFTEIKL